MALGSVSESGFCEQTQFLIMNGLNLRSYECSCNVKDKSRTFQNRSRQVDMRIRYRTMPSPPMTCPVGRRGNNAQDRLQLVALLLHEFSYI